MKKPCLLLSIAFAVVTACQHAPEPAPVDLNAEKAAVSVLFEKFDSTFKAKDATALATFLTDDVLFLGTDPSEFMNKQQITDAWKQLLADSTLEIKYIRAREIRVAPDGYSATAVDQYIMTGFSPKIPWRNVYHLIKSNEHWVIDFISSSFIPKNEDIPKLNKALE